MARTLLNAIEGRDSDDPLPLRVPKKETTKLDESVPVHRTSGIKITDEIEWTVTDYYDETTNSFPEMQLNWTTAKEEDFQRLWIENIHVQTTSPSTIQFVCEHMNELNCLYGLWTCALPTEDQLKLTDCFCPEAVFIINYDNLIDNYYLSGDLFINPCFKDVKRFHIMDKHVYSPLNLDFINSDLKKVTIYHPTPCVFDYKPFSRTFQGWMSEAESPIKRFRLEFTEKYNVNEVLPLLLEGISYTVAWKYCDHSSSLIREQIENISQYERLEETDAIVVTLKQELAGKMGLLMLDSTGLYFEVITMDEFEKNGAISISSAVIQRYYRLLSIDNF